MFHMIERIVKAHEQIEETAVAEVIPDHIDRKQASQAEFDHAKKTLRKLYGKPRCIMCEMAGEESKGNIESHHVFEWCHWNDNDMQKVEIVLRALSPFIHGLYMISKEEVLAGKTIPTLWEHPDFKGKPFNSLDDARNQLFLCHAHHQQSTKAQIADGYDRVGLHHVVWVIWLQYFAMKEGKLPVHHVDHHEDGIDRTVEEND
jgi:hypothetical protein